MSKTKSRSIDEEVPVSARGIPDIVVGRLPVYLRELRRMARENSQPTTSSHELGHRLGISSAQIRKDLSHFGEFGKQGTGYHVSYLIDQLSSILHLDKEWAVALVGAGYLGHALAHFGGFKNRGFRVTCIFDSDPAKIGEEMRGLVVQNDRKIEATIRDSKVDIAIIAVPPAVAQTIADRLVAAGVKALLCYAPITLEVPEGIQVSYSDPVIQLQHMTFYLSA